MGLRSGARGFCVPSIGSTTHVGVSGSTRGTPRPSAWFVLGLGFGIGFGFGLGLGLDCPEIG